MMTDVAHALIQSGSFKLPPDPDYATYMQQWASLYDGTNYEKGIAAYCLRQSHRVAESAFQSSHFFSRVLEVGAGTGAHLQHVQHGFDEYWMTDLNTPMLEKILYTPPNVESQGKVFVASEDATQLSFSDDYFDRVIATHVLEHLPRPHEVLREWARVLKPGGTLTIVLPCDPGVGWRLGRYLFVRRNLIRAGFQYDYWMAREHINPINVLVAFCRHYFSRINEIWWPLRLPSVDGNLFYIIHATV